MKQHKLIVAVSSNDKDRIDMVRRLAVRSGFARTPSDAAKIVRAGVHDYELSKAYFVLAETYNLAEAPVTTQRLYEMAARGMAVIIGVKRLQQRFELLCEAYYDINQLK